MTDEIDYTDMLEEYKKTGQIPLIWQYTAREFVCAANILRAKYEDENFFTQNAPGESSSNKPYNAIRLLYGLAMENLLKGLLVAQGIDATSTGELNKQLKSHKLVHLWEMAGLPLTGQTESVLKILRWAVETGKYPIGTKPDPNAPTTFWIAVVSFDKIAELLEIVEDSLREKQANHALKKTDLLKLCYG